MKKTTLIKSVLSAWFMSIIYHQVELNTGVELTPLLCVAVITMVVGIYRGCREDNETKEEEV